MPRAREGGTKVPNARKGSRKETPVNVSSSESSSSSSGEEESNQPPIKHLQVAKRANKRKASADTKPTRKHKDRTPDSDEYDGRYESDGSEESDGSDDSDEGKKLPPRKKARTNAKANTTITRPTGKSKGPGRGKGKTKASEARGSLFMTTDLQWIDDEKSFHEEVHSRTPKEVFEELDRDVPPVTIEEINQILPEEPEYDEDWAAEDEVKLIQDWEKDTSQQLLLDQDPSAFPALTVRKRLKDSSHAIPLFSEFMLRIEELRGHTSAKRIISNNVQPVVYMVSNDEANLLVRAANLVSTTGMPVFRNAPMYKSYTIGRDSRDHKNPPKKADLSLYLRRDQDHGESDSDVVVDVLRERLKTAEAKSARDDARIAELETELQNLKDTRATESRIRPPPVVDHGIGSDIRSNATATLAATSRAASDMIPVPGMEETSEDSDSSSESSSDDSDVSQRPANDFKSDIKAEDAESDIKEEDSVGNIKNEDESRYTYLEGEDIYSP
ncbi:hypothetical protein CSAL01_10297 [Colletotrichum salicis]|uniref:Uncharacterized protein n=1 Tax=Colletotrichum salicis TaxID=1209931 RepID=A0A135UGS8_9PEZI|nr:hypothetical protein CSAL01_10297 [Colletotrichum salicis]